jgi:hypothetical protein
MDFQTYTHEIMKYITQNLPHSFMQSIKKNKQMNVVWISSFAYCHRNDMDMDEVMPLLSSCWLTSFFYIHFWERMNNKNCNNICSTLFCVVCRPISTSSFNMMPFQSDCSCINMNIHPRNYSLLFCCIHRCPLYSGFEIDL